MLAPYRLLGDDRLARLAESGSEQAFGAVYSRYGRVLHGYCRSLVEDEHDARDAMQNTMLKAFLALRRGGGPKGPLRPWLFRIAHNESVTILRQRARRPDALDDAVSAPAQDTHRQAVARERLAEVLHDMQGLTSHQRGALVMRELGGMGYDEIGAALETSPLAARQAVFAARRALAVPRASLRALLPPVPAGAAVLALIGGGGSGGVAVKVVATAASVGIGIAAVELPHSPERGDRLAARTAAEPEREPGRPLVVAAAAPAVQAARIVVARKEEPAAGTAAPAVERKVVVRRRERAVAPPRRERRARPEARRDPRPDERREPREDIEQGGFDGRHDEARERPASFDGERRFARGEDCPPREGGERAPATAPEPAPEQPPTADPPPTEPPPAPEPAPDADAPPPPA